MNGLDRVSRRSLASQRTLAPGRLTSALCGTLLAVGCAPSQSYDASAVMNGVPANPSVSVEPQPPDSLPSSNLPTSVQTLRGTIGPEGGTLAGEAGSAFENVRLVIPPQALPSATAIEIESATEFAPLPTTAVRCGPLFALHPAGLGLAVPATLTLPVDQAAVIEHFRFEDEVKVWASNATGWGQKLQTDSSPGSVSVEIEALTQVAPGVNPPDQKQLVRFALRPNPKFAACLAQFPNDTRRQPEAEAIVVRGSQNDGLFLLGRNIKAQLSFSMFTVENSALDAEGAAVPNFNDFGLAVYQSDFDANARGLVRTAIRTILLDQAFAFDPGADLKPTSAFNVGFWFNDPKDAAACGFDPTNPTPFNEDHDAGPMAMISLPDKDTGLGPLCTNPDTSGVTPVCVP